MIPDARRIHHPLGCLNARRIRIFITVIDHFFDPALDDRLGTFIAREKGDIELRSGKASAAVIQDRIQFAVR